MLRTQGDVISQFLVKMNTASSYGFYTDQILTDWCSNANQWAAAQYKWPFTEIRYSTTAASAVTNEDGYTTLTYPESFRSDSIRLLTVDGKQYNKKNFYKWREFVENNSADASKIYSDFNRSIFFSPSVSGFSGTVAMWGQINVAQLPSDSGIQVPTAPTIFTDIENDGNEALVYKMMEYAAQREKSPISVQKGQTVSAASNHAASAKAILEAIWKRVADEQYGYQDTLNEGMWKRFDVTRGGFKEDTFRRDQWSL
jgi:hypothetical protein